MDLTEAKSELTRATAARQAAEEHLSAIGEARRRVVAASSADHARSEEIHGRIKAAILAGGEPSRTQVEQLARIREATKFYERLRRELVVDELAAKLSITEAGITVAEAECIAVAAELDTYRRKQAECLQELAEIEGGRIEATLDGEYSRSLHKRIEEAKSNVISLRFAAQQQTEQLAVARQQFDSWVRGQR